MLESAFRSKPRLDDVRFFLRWLRRPGRVGAVVPSGEALANALASQVEVAARGVVIELGAGTGRVTEALLAAGVAPQDLVPVERDNAFAAMLADRYPNLRIVQGDAQQLRHLTQKSEIGPVKAVVSSLPLLNLSHEDRRQIVSQVFAVLEPRGTLIQYTYGPRSPVPGELCAELGLSGARTGWILANLPPAAVWRYSSDHADSRLAQAA